jgi:hypothetical protein
VFEEKDEDDDVEQPADDMEMPIELDVEDDDELSEALNDAPEKDLVDLAGL